jgi:uncharacterized BrkB/YihY/UPF0761 family membrane protein
VNGADELAEGEERPTADAPLPRRVRLRRTIDTTVDRATTTAETARSRWTAVDVAFTVRDRDQRVVGSVLAGAIAFRLFVYLLPLFLAVVTLLGLLVSLDDAAPEEAGDGLGMSHYLVDSVATAARETNRSLWILVPVAGWAIYSAGVGAVKVLRAIHALAWGRPVERLSRSGVAAVGAFGCAVAVLAVVAATQALRERSAGLGVGFSLGEVALLVALWWVVSHALPRDPDAGWWALLPGAVLVGVGAWGLHLLSVYFLARRVASASELYGSLGVAAALLAWLYLLGRLMVASAMLNATLWERRPGPEPEPKPQSPPEPQPPSQPQRAEGTEP